MSNAIKVIIFVLFLMGILVCIFFIGTGNLTNKESALLSIILTILSILASWILTHLYSESQHRQAIQEVQEFHRANLRTFAVKAAEKVNNLSNELNRLTAYLQEELDSSEVDQVETSLLIKEERIAGAIHIVTTLKSVNDTSLSDWEGVIGDLLDRQREQREEKEEELRDIVERFESLWESQTDSRQNEQANTQTLKSEIDSIRKDLRSVITTMGVTPVPLPKIPRKVRNAVEARCPVCKEGINYQQKKKPNSVKSLNCKSCGTKLVSRYDDGAGFNIEIRRTAREQVTCPACKKLCEVELDTFPSSSLIATCENCRKDMIITRGQSDIRVKPRIIVNTEQPLTEEFIKLVQDNLPAQPWPKGIRKSLGSELEISPSQIDRAIKELINRGVYKHQIDGRLYTPEPEMEPSH